MHLTEPKRNALFLTVLVGVFWLMITPVRAQDDNSSGISLNASAGFDSYFRAEYGVPVQISVANSGAAVEGEVRIVVGQASASDEVVYNAPVSLPTQSNKRITLYPHVSGFVNELSVELLDASGRLIDSTTTNRLRQLSFDDLLYGVISPDPAEFSFLENISGTRSRAAVAFLELEDVPEVAAAWNALDILIFNDVDTGTMTAGQLEALRGWVSTGGQLVMTGGTGWQMTTASLDDMLPVTVSGIESVDDLPALSDKTGVSFRDPGPYLVTASSLRTGELRYHQDGLPLLARRDWGLGSVYFLALDPRLAPMLDWDGGERLWAEVAGLIPSVPLWGQGIQNGYAASTAVTSLPSLALPSVLQLVLFLLVYVLVVGPANYLFLKRLKRRELAWVTIPALVLLFSGMAYVTGFQLKGNEIIINQMSVAYGRVGGEHVRAQTLVGLYSPRRSTYDLVFPGATMARPFERSFGTLGGGGSLKAITRSTDLTMKGVRVDVSDTETFVADSYHMAPAVSGEAILSLDGSDFVLQATFQNHGSTALENVSMLFGADIISLGDLGPGELESLTHRIGAALSPSGPSPGLPSSGPIFVPGPGSGSPLTDYADRILGTTNYYDDSEAFPRWQLLQAIDGSGTSGRSSGTSSYSSSTDVITLIAWSEIPLLELKLGEDQFSSLATTLFFLEMPVSQNIALGGEVSVPISLLNWTVLDSSGSYQPTIRNLYMNGDWVEFEYTPWPEFQDIQVSQLEVAIVQQDAAVQPAPEIRLWDWQQETWITIDEAGWGITRVGRPARYIGTGNAVRIRIQDRGSGGITIQEVYPIISGELR